MIIANAKERKRAYNERVIQMEKGTFTPIVMSTSGRVGIKADRHQKGIASLIAEKLEKVMRMSRTTSELDSDSA